MKPRLAFLWRFLLAASPALFPLWMIVHYGVDMPYWDQMDEDLAGLHIKAHDGTLNFADLAAQHNEHRILVPRLVYLVLGKLTHGNTVAEMLASWAIVLATSLVLLWLGRTLLATDGPDRRPDSRPPRPLFWWFLANVLIFTPGQVDNWLWGMGLANFMPMLWTALAIAAAVAPFGLATRTGAVIGLSALATWSSGNGMLSWGLAGGVLFWAPNWTGFRSRWKLMVLFTAVVALAVALYFTGMGPPNHRGATPYDSTLWAKLHYLATFAGAPFAIAFNTAPTAGATGAGVVLLLFLLACVLRFLQLWRNGEDPERLRGLLAWFAIAGFALGSAVIAACARAGLGATQATASRYVTFSIYLGVALLRLVPALEPWRLLHQTATSAATGTIRQATLIAGSTAILLLAIVSLPTTLLMGRRTRTMHAQAHAVALLVDVLPGHPLMSIRVFPDLALGTRMVEGLARIGYLRPALFTSRIATDYADPEAPPPEKTGRLEQATEATRGWVLFSGWAVAGDRPADLVVLCMNDEQGRPHIIDMAAVANPRPDKTAALGADNTDCGWSLQVQVGDTLPSGRVTFSAWALDSASGRLRPLAGTVQLSR